MACLRDHTREVDLLLFRPETDGEVLKTRSLSFVCYFLFVFVTVIFGTSLIVFHSTTAPPLVAPTCSEGPTQPTPITRDHTLDTHFPSSDPPPQTWGARSSTERNPASSVRGYGTQAPESSRHSPRVHTSQNYYTLPTRRFYTDGVWMRTRNSSDPCIWTE